jgi:hypothetical protein
MPWLFHLTRLFFASSEPNRRSRQRHWLEPNLTIVLVDYADDWVLARMAFLRQVIFHVTL